MKKFKIVRFIDGRARISVTRDITNLELNDADFLNPNLEAVRGVPPEFWTVENKQIVPIKDEFKIDEIRQRLHVPEIIRTNTLVDKLKNSIKFLYVIIAILAIGFSILAYLG